MMTSPDLNSISNLPNPAGEFDLHRFMPYLIRVFYTQVSSAVERSYAPMFDITPAEWRALAVLGPYETLSASDIVERSSMTKVHVSRAIKSLREKNLIRRDIDGSDKRKASLKMTPNGVETYGKIVKGVLEVEEKLLDGLSDKEISNLISTMEKINANAESVN